MRELLIERFEKPTRITLGGAMVWKNEDGELHRENDLPAIIYADSSKFWYKNGKLHRENYMPAIIYADGSKSWYKNGKWFG